MQVKFEQNHMVQTTRNFDIFDKKRAFKNHFLKKRFCIWNNCLVLNY